MCTLNKCGSVCSHLQSFLWLFSFACVYIYNLHVYIHVHVYLLLHQSVFACLQNELVFTDVIRLSVNGAFSEGPESAQQPSIGKVSISQLVILCMYIRMYIFNF